MGGVFAVTAVELAFAEVHGGNNRHYHHRSDLVDGPVRHPDGTLTPTAEKAPSETSEDGKAKEVENKAFMQCLLLEMGILFHSVFIGGQSLPSRILPQLTSVSTQAWHSVSLAANPLSSYSLRSFSTVSTSFSIGLAFLGHHFFCPRHGPTTHPFSFLSPRVRPMRGSRR